MTRGGSAVALLLFAASAVAAEPAMQTVKSWTFMKPADWQGWEPNSDVKAIVSEQAIRGETTGTDPFITSPVFELKAKPWQQVVLYLQSDKAGQGQLYWTNTLNSPYAGFMPDKVTNFDLAASPDLQKITLMPFWHHEQKIIRLRLDLLGGQKFVFHHLEIQEPVQAAAPSAATAWDAAALATWATDGLSTPQVSGQVARAKVERTGGRWFAPALLTPVGDRVYASLRMRVQRGTRGAIAFASDQANGLHRVDFPVRGDGAWHTYNVDLASSKDWGGNVLALSLTPSNAAGDEVEVESLKLSEDPVGPADLLPLYVGPADAAARVGKPVRVIARLLNQGAEPATVTKVEATPPAGVQVKLLGEPKPFEFGSVGEIALEVRASQPVDGTLSLKLTGPGAPAEPLTCRLQIGAGPQVPKTDYIPVPKPTPSKYKVGTYYFPGWNTALRWSPIDRNGPQRKPVLGWYDEANPEIVDWQIKWAREHAISFFLVDWYWSAGNTHLMHWVEAMQRARYRDMLQWAVMWANHNAPNTHSEADWKTVTQFWIDHYFKLPNYLRVNGKPAVYLWAPSNLRRDVGGSAVVAKLLKMSDDMARAAGLPGITFVAMNAGPAEAKTLAAEGYVGNATYHGWDATMRYADDKRLFPYQVVVDHSREAWEEKRKGFAEAGMFHQPTADTGWDARPWHGDASIVIYDRTPEKFEALLRNAKAYLDEHHEDTVILGPWNEWGEGSYIEPNLEYGFGMLDAVRKVFGDGSPAQPDLVPADLGRGPYDLDMTPEPTRTAWTFEKESFGWNGAMGFGPVAVRDGALRGTTTSNDPAFGSPTLNVRAKAFKYVLIRLSVKGPVPAGDSLQLFWATSSRPVSEAASLRAPLIADGKVHTYLLPVGENSRWNGRLQSLRLDPGNSKGVDVALEEVRLCAEKPAG